MASGNVDFLDMQYKKYKNSTEPPKAPSTKIASEHIGTIRPPGSATFWPRNNTKTHYANVYGPWINVNNDIQEENYQNAQERTWNWAGKSGLTPLLHPDSPYDLLNFPDVSTWPQLLKGEVQDWLHQHQKLNMGGFSSAALHRWGAVNVHVKDPRGRLSNAIHPLLDRDRWHWGNGVDIRGFISESGKDDMTDQMMKNISAHNNAENQFWDCLDPALRLLSNYLTHSCCVPWVDACLNSARQIIDGTEDWIERETEVLEMLEHRRFYRRRRHEAARNAMGTEPERSGLEDIHKELQLMASYVRWEICLKEMKDTRSYGTTQMKLTADQKDIDHILIHIQYELLAPLVGDYLTPSQRVIALWGVVHTMLHEFGHALNLWRDYKAGMIEGLKEGTIREPYFEDEVLNEMGYSFTNALLGGISNGINMDSFESIVDAHGNIQKNIYPAFAFLHSPWPYPGKTSSTGAFLGPPTKDAFDNSPTDYWSLSVAWLASLYDDAYWEAVRACEGQILKFPRQYGYRTYVGDSEYFKHLRTRPAMASKDPALQADIDRDVEKWVPCDVNMRFAGENALLAQGVFGMAEADRRAWGLPGVLDVMDLS